MILADPWNVLDWVVVVIFLWQALLWYMLEFIWLPSDYEILGTVPSAETITANHTVTQDDFIEIITSMTTHSSMADLVLKLGSVNCKSEYPPTQPPISKFMIPTTFLEGESTNIF